jgi:hypothetical protein
MASSLVILRPSRRWLTIQLIVLAALAVVGVLAAWHADGRQGAIIAAAVAAVMLSMVWAGHTKWMRYYAPRAIVATDDYVATLSRTGERRYVRWDAVRRATHAATLLGMRWRLETPDACIILRDIGLDPNRWGELWRLLWVAVARRGGRVRVDAMSNALFD